MQWWDRTDLLAFSFNYRPLKTPLLARIFEVTAIPVFNLRPPKYTHLN